jgi:deoxyribose-phosphate aldolase
MRAPHREHLPDALAQAIDYTDLRKEITYADVEALCLEATVYGLHTVVVPSALVPRAVRSLTGACRVSCPIAYPFGTQAAAVKAHEAEVAVAAGAAELEVVPHFGALRARHWQDAAAELQAIAQVARGATLKLVLETASLEPDILERVCKLARDAGFAFVSNTIGFRLVSTQPSTEGSASEEAVRRLCQLAKGTISVKAIGGVTALADVERLLAAGAKRVAVSAQRGLLAAWAEGASR